MGAMNEPDLGYVFFSGQSCLGDGPLDVILREKPTQAHFDPEKIHVIVNAQRGVQTLDIHHPWRLGTTHQVCAGHIRISDRFQKRINVFTFGGQLRITAVADHTLCQFTSPAPFLELTDGCPTTLLFANEIDILLAKERARLNPRTAGDFDAKLIAVDPLQLYICCLNTIQSTFAHDQHFSGVTWQHFKHELNLEITRLKRENNWPSSISTLAELIES